MFKNNNSFIFTYLGSCDFKKKSFYAKLKCICYRNTISLSVYIINIIFVDLCLILLSLAFSSPFCFWWIIRLVDIGIHVPKLRH